MERLTLVISGELAGRKVESLMLRELNISKTLMRRLKNLERGIELNGKRAFTTARVETGDVLSVDVFSERAENAPPREAGFGVLYEDEHLLVIDKPAGMAVHYDERYPESPSVEGAVSAYLGESAVMHPVSRLDRGTTGVMTVAKSAYVTELMRRGLHTDAFRKTYIGISTAVPEPGEGEIALPIGLDGNSKLKRAAREDGAPSRTGYKTLFVENGLAAVMLSPYTGRTHQLRVHMAAIGCPLAGDWLYGKEARELISRPALHSWRLVMLHPISGERLELASPVPDDMKALMPSYLPAL